MQGGAAAATSAARPKSRIAAPCGSSQGVGGCGSVFSVARELLQPLRDGAVRHVRRYFAAEPPAHARRQVRHRGREVARAVRAAPKFQRHHRRRIGGARARPAPAAGVAVAAGLAGLAVQEKPLGGRADHLAVLGALRREVKHVHGPRRCGQAHNPAPTAAARALA
jgi:hypothetical protein